MVIVTTLAFCCRSPISNPRLGLDSLAQTTRGKVLDFFVKPQNGLVALVFEKRCFPGDFQGQNRSFELKSIVSKLEAYYERKSSTMSPFFEDNRDRTELSLMCASMTSSSSCGSA